jgi:thiamine-monophosphate kinase
VTVATLGEFRLIRRIPAEAKNSCGLIQGIGDDAAILSRPRANLLWTTDNLIEGIHFQLRWIPPYTLGRKALSVNLSDIAAMGGRPLFYTVSVGVPVTWTVQQWDDFYRGLHDVGQSSRAFLAGGNTCRSPQVSINIGLIGEAPHGAILRQGARVGDLVCLTGTVGDSALGLELLQKGGNRKKEAVSYLIKRHLDPEARINEGLTLSKEKIPTSMIDISDGLLQDLGHLCRASAVGAMIEANTIPLSTAYADLAKERLEFAMSGGEDYELLFTVPPKNEGKLYESFRRLGTPVTRIGVVTEKAKGIRVVGEDGKTIRFQRHGYNHFRSGQSHPVKKPQRRATGRSPLQ